MNPTHEPEIVLPVDLCTPDGRRLDPEARGWSRRPLHRANLRGRRWRTKRWEYWAVLAGDLVVGFVYADVGYLGLASIWWADLGRGTSGGAQHLDPLARSISLPDVPGAEPLRLRTPALRMDVTDDPDITSDTAGTRLVVDWTEASGAPGSLDVVLARPPGHESLSVVIPWSEQRFQFTTKDPARPATGVVRLGDRVHAIGDDAWGVLDVGRGRWPYSTRWNWGAGAGRSVEGPVVGVQLGGRWTVGTGFTENAVTVDGRLHKIGRELRWEYDWDRPMRPWRVTDPGGALELTLTPRFDRHDRTDAVVAAHRGPPGVRHVVGHRARRGRQDPHAPRRPGLRRGVTQPLVGPATRDDRRVSDDVLSASGLVKTFGERTAVDDVGFTIAPGRDLRAARPQRRRQDHHDPHGVRPAAPGRRHGAGRRTGPGGDLDRREVGHRARPPGDRALPRPLGTREPAVLRPARGAHRRRARRARRRRARGGRPRGPCRRARRELLGGHAAPVQHRGGPAAPPGAADPRRAHRRRRPPEPQPDPREHRGARRRGPVGALHDALHGGGRAALRPDRHHGRGAPDRRGHTTPAGDLARPSRRTSRSWSSRSRRARWPTSRRSSRCGR